MSESKEKIQETIFSQIIRQEIPCELLYQDEYVTAFHDIAPQAPIHILIVPNHQIPTLNDISAEDEPSLARLWRVAQQLAQQFGIAEQGYRLILNCNQDGGQEVAHLHLHLLGGEPLGKIRA